MPILNIKENLNAAMPPEHVERFKALIESEKKPVSVVMKEWLEILKRSPELIRSLSRQMLMIPEIRNAVGRCRYEYFVRHKYDLKTINSDKSYAVTVHHNLRRVKPINDHCSQRMNILIRPLSVLQLLGPQSKVLVIGPRTESDILSLIGHGFSKENVRGIDLISYSPLVDLGDMHAMPYRDNEWDAVLSAFSFSYSTDQQIAAREMVRVTKNGGLIGIGVEYSDLTPDDVRRLVGYAIEDEGTQLNSESQILNFFEGHIGKVYFSHDAPVKHTSDSQEHYLPGSLVIATIFSVKK